MAAPKGNKYALGNNGGVKLKYNNARILQKKVEKYFIWCEGEYEERKGETTKTTKNLDGTTTIITETYTYTFCIREPEKPAVTGLALFLGFESRQSMYDYKERKEFSYIIKRAILLIENSYEKGLWNEKCTGVIFALKNMGWVDKKEIDNNIKGDKENPVSFDISKLSKQTKRQILKDIIPKQQ